jgi:predicted nucleic acid-binding protein
LEAEREAVVISAASLGEIDYLLRSRLGNNALLQFMSDVEAGSFRIETLTTEDWGHCARLLRSHADLDVGLSDVAVAVTAERLGTTRILTVDVRDFRILRTRRGRLFKLLPADFKG